MAETPAQRALTASTLALVVAGGALAMFLPPLVAHTTASVLRTVAVGACLATAVLLHLVFLGIGARRLQRSVAGWVALAALLFPVGGATALILLGWFTDEARTPAPHRG